MATIAQTSAIGIRANRQNALKPTGPNTEKRAAEAPHTPAPHRLALGPVPAVATERNSTPAPRVPAHLNNTHTPKPPILTPNNDLSAQNKPNFQNPKTTAISFAARSYTKVPSRRNQKNKPNQSQFQTGRLLVNRMKPKFLNFHLKNSLTGAEDSLEC